MRLKSPTDESICVILLNGQGMRIGPEGRDVPEMFRKEAFANGAIPDTSSAKDFMAPVETQPSESNIDLLVAGIKKMLVENPDDFTGSGLPDRRVLSRIVGWNVSVQELSPAWAQVEEETRGDA